MTLFTPLLIEAVTGDTAITYHAQDYRNIISTLAPNQGIVHAGDLAVSQRAAGANLSVDVAAGRCVIAGGSIANQGTYICLSDAVTNVPIGTPNATNPRIDLIVAQIHDKQADGGTSYGWTINTVQGTAAGTPVAPSVPTSAMVLAQISVAANATSITTGNITDKRALAGVGDVPKWDLYGTAGSGQSIPSNSATRYAPSLVNQLVGCQHSSGLITIQTPGRYALYGGARLAASGSACDRVVEVTSSTVVGGLTRKMGSTNTSASSQPVAASGSFFLNAGDTIFLSLYQNSGGALLVDNANGDTAFTGVWVGP